MTYLADADFSDETPGKVRFATGSAKLGVFFLFFSALILWALQRPENQRSMDSLWKWGAWFTTALFLAAGVAMVLRRRELEIDTEARTFQRRVGYWPAANREFGVLGSDASVILTRRLWSDADGPTTVEVWVTSISLTAANPPISVLITSDEIASRRALAYLARTLRLPMVDRTGKTQATLSWKDLPPPLDLTARSGKELWSYAHSGKGYKPPVFHFGKKAQAKTKNPAEKP